MLIQLRCNMGTLSSRQWFENRNQETNIEEKKGISVRSKGNTPSFSHWIGQLSQVKKSVKIRRSVIIENSKSFCTDFLKIPLKPWEYILHLEHETVHTFRNEKFHCVKNTYLFQQMV